VSQDQLVLVPLWYAVFLLSLTCHEAAHAFAAYRGGDPTAYLGGQVTLNPLPHVQREPFGTILVPLMTYFFMGWMMGWASAPYDPLWEDRHPRRGAAMAAAGPLANLLLAALAFTVLKVGLSSGWWLPPVTEYIEYDLLVRPVTEGTAWLEGLGRLCCCACST
jgi:membrane-associated protease RseP (regulator of RpoE activity)